MSRRFGFWSPTSRMIFGDVNSQTWIQAVPVGQFEHPIYGTLDFTPKRIQKYYENFKSNVRGIQLDIDYDHKSDTSKAAGWVVDMQVRLAGDGPADTNGLWFLVEWTPAAYDALQNKEYRYFSPEILDEWEDPKGNVYTDVIAGGGITNRPFLKDLMPINLSELVSDVIPQPRKENQVDFEEFLTKLGEILNRPVTAEQAIGAFTQLSEDASKVPNLEKQLAEAQKPDPEAVRQKQFAELFPEEAKQLADSTRRTKLAETREIATRWLKNSESGLGVSPAQLQKLVGVRIELSEPDAKSFDEFMDDVVKNGLVNFNKVGEDEDPNANPSDNPIVQFMSEVKKLQGENKDVSLTEAARQVAAKDPKLAEAYQKAQRAKKAV